MRLQQNPLQQVISVVEKFNNEWVTELWWLGSRTRGQNVVVSPEQKLYDIVKLSPQRPENQNADRMQTWDLAFKLKLLTGKNRLFSSSWFCAAQTWLCGLITLYTAVVRPPTLHSRSLLGTVVEDSVFTSTVAAVPTWQWFASVVLQF